MSAKHHFIFFTTAFSLIAASVPVHAVETFKVCADPLHPPYSKKDLSGFENKIAALFAEQLAQKVEYTWFPQRIGFIRNTLKAKIEDTDHYKCDIIMGVPASYDRTLTTKPYYHSSYVLLIVKGRGWDEIKQAEQLKSLPLERQQQLRIAMFDRGPGTTWLQNSGLLDQGIPYQTMTGDPESNTAMKVEKDLKSGKIDMVVLWGPMAGYVISNSPKNTFNVLPMLSSRGMKFDFSIAMGVRYGDKKRRETLNKLIDDNIDKIQSILASYHIPLLPIPEPKPRKDND